MQALLARPRRTGADLAELTLEAAQNVPYLDPASDKLLVRVHACALNPADVKFLSGALQARSATFTPGLEVCGTVEAVGAKVAAAGSFRIGDRVVAALRPPLSSAPAGSGGGLAQFAVVEAALAAVVPVGVSSQQAVALPLAGTTALHAINDTSITVDSRVLVLGAASDVGRLVVQLAKRRGATFVAGTTPRKELVAKLPLDLAIVDDDEHPKWYDAVDSTQRFHVVIDCFGEPDGWRHVDKVLVTGGNRGILAMLLSNLVSEGEVRSTTEMLTLGFVNMWKSFWRMGAQLKIVAQFPTAAALQELLALVESGELKPALDESTPVAFTADDVQRSIARLASHQQTGKLVVQIPQEN